MPYITQKDRGILDNHIDALIGMLLITDDNEKVNAGEVNYCITRIVNSLCPQPYSYSNINTAIGVLECAKLELYRRVAVPYEDIKKTKNGDVKEYKLENYEVHAPSTLGQNFH